MKFGRPALGLGIEGFDIGSSCGVSRKEAFSEDQFGEVEDMRVAEIGSGIRIPGDGDEMKNGTEVEFTEDICGQTNQEISRAAVSEFETVVSENFRQKEKSSSGVLSLVDQLSIMLWKRVMYCHRVWGAKR